MKKVLCIGQCCMDMIFGGLPEIPKLGQEVYGSEFALKPGGGANTPLSLRRLGVPVALLTALGADELGHRIGSILESAGIALVGEQYLSGSRTAVSAVLSTREDRCFASYGGQGELPWDALEAAIENADIVQTYLGYCRDYPIARLCRKYGKLLCVDANWQDVQKPSEILPLIHQVDYLKLNLDEARILTGGTSPEECLHRLSGRCGRGVIITRGEKGSIGQTKSGEYAVPAVPEGLFRDACGAGDNYAAGFLYGLSRGEKFPNAMVYGSRLAGLSVTWYGGNDETLNCTKIDYPIR